jgi:hypothetical protein
LQLHAVPPGRTRLPIRRGPSNSHARACVNGLKRAQMDLDCEPEKYKHYYLNEIPDRYRSKVDVRLFSPGERIVFLPYTEAMYARTQVWLNERGLFDERAPALDYAGSVAA